MIDIKMIKKIQIFILLIFIIFIYGCSSLIGQSVYIDPISQKEKAVFYCDLKCDEALKNKCSPSSMVSLCMSYGTSAVPEGWIDLNFNDVNDLDTTTFEGIGVCESEIPCSLLIDECCGRIINPSICLDILIDYWDILGLTKSQIKETINNDLITGINENCNPEESELFWYDMKDKKGNSYKDYAGGY